MKAARFLQRCQRMKSSRISGAKFTEIPYTIGDLLVNSCETNDAQLLGNLTVEYTAPRCNTFPNCNTFPKCNTFFGFFFIFQKRYTLFL